MLPDITNSFTKKQILSISHNKFHGNMRLSPDFDFTKLNDDDVRIQYIDMSYNQLSGPIGRTFMFLPSMRYFDVSGNTFTGTFPSDMNWLGIEHLAASNNSLTGTIPIGYPTLSKWCVALSVSGSPRCTLTLTFLCSSFRYERKSVRGGNPKGDLRMPQSAISDSIRQLTRFNPSVVSRRPPYAARVGSQ
jgi:hypothetical protein